MKNDYGLEDLLDQREKIRKSMDKKVVDSPLSATEEHPEDAALLRADKSASLFDLIKMIDRLVSATMGDLDVEFVPDEDKTPIRLPETNLDHPYITYKVIERIPKGELKPRVRQHVEEKRFNVNDGRTGQVYGQKFSAIVQFDIFASVYATAEQVMERFEELLFTYTGHFKRSGVAEIYFKKQFTDSSYDIYRQNVSIRSIQYYVEVEKLFVVFRDKIQEINILGPK